MTKYIAKPIEVEITTFDEFIEYGKTHGANIVNGMPWSFEFKGHPVTHENDKCYLVSCAEGQVRFIPEDILVEDSAGLHVGSKPFFEENYLKVDEK